jgi:hypothetical protein
MLRLLPPKKKNQYFELSYIVFFEANKAFGRQLPASVVPLYPPYDASGILLEGRIRSFEAPAEYSLFSFKLEMHHRRL